MSIDSQSLLRLMTWLSPAFPVGAFSYSHGLEWAIDVRIVGSPDALYDWIADLVAHGSGWNDAVLLAEAWHAAANPQRLSAACELGEALAASSERHLETIEQGAAFLAGASAWLAGQDGVRMSYPVAIGFIAARLDVGLEPALIAFLHAFTSSLVSAAIRLVPLGQSQGLRVMARLEPLVMATARRAAKSSLDDLGSATIAADIASMRHETLQTRLFRS